MPKKRDKSDVNNYRGITLMSIFSKIYSHIFYERLRTFKSNMLISDSQFGFRAQKSTVNCIFILLSIDRKFWNEIKKLYCAFKDFRKAFDLVYRNEI